jgi:hypothetical protein
MSSQKRKPTLCLDFDGVIHRYSRGWHDGTTYDDPVPGALDAIRRSMDAGHPVFILSTRRPSQIEAWIGKHAPDISTSIISTVNDDAPFWNRVGVLGITRLKLAAALYVDDRGYRFDPTVGWNTRDRDGFTQEMNVGLTLRLG